VPHSHANLVQGTLDLLVLKALALTPLHGLGVARRVEDMTRGTFQVKPGSLFPALYRMEDAGWIAGSWGTSESNRRARFYRITALGKQQLEAQVSQWRRVSLGISFALEAT
jgi:PadR family transcriptional regulator, regulatory protein PadR